MKHGVGSALGGEVRALILKYVAASTAEADLIDSTPLGSDGLGLDSVGLVELLLEAEATWGVPFPAEMLEKQALTIGGLIQHIQGQRAAA